MSSGFRAFGRFSNAFEGLARLIPVDSKQDLYGTKPSRRKPCASSQAVAAQCPTGIDLLGHTFSGTGPWKGDRLVRCVVGRRLPLESLRPTMFWTTGRQPVFVNDPAFGRIW